MYCPNCRTELPDGSLFCMNCGSKVAAEPTTEPTTEPTPAAPQPTVAQPVYPTYPTQTEQAQPTVVQPVYPTQTEQAQPTVVQPVYPTQTATVQPTVVQPAYPAQTVVRDAAAAPAKKKKGAGVAVVLLIVIVLAGIVAAGAFLRDSVLGCTGIGTNDGGKSSIDALCLAYVEAVEEESTDALFDIYCTDYLGVLSEYDDNIAALEGEDHYWLDFKGVGVSDWDIVEKIDISETNTDLYDNVVSSFDSALGLEVTDVQYVTMVVTQRSGAVIDLTLNCVRIDGRWYVCGTTDVAVQTVEELEPEDLLEEYLAAVESGDKDELLALYMSDYLDYMVEYYEYYGQSGLIDDYDLYWYNRKGMEIDYYDNVYIQTAEELLGRSDWLDTIDEVDAACGFEIAESVIVDADVTYTNGDVSYLRVIFFREEGGEWLIYMTICEYDDV